MIRSTPPAQDIEEEKFDFSFELIYVSKEDATFIEQMIMKISEIEKVEVNKLEREHLIGTEQAEAAATLDTVSEQSKADAASQSSQPQANS